MLMNGKRECPFTDEIVSYIYGEIDGVEQGDFEMHLADCTTCTDDFAAISNARFSVFEWRKEEFDKIATPAIIIPELAKQPLPDTAESGWFGGIAALLSFARPMAVAAVLLAFLGVGLITLAYFKNSESLMAANGEIKVPAIQENNVKSVTDSPEATPQSEVSEPTKASTSKKQTTSFRQVRATEIKRTNNMPRRLSSPQMAKKPVLNDFNDETDDSLRLADLFDEVGG